MIWSDPWMGGRAPDEKRLGALTTCVPHEFSLLLAALLSGKSTAPVTMRLGSRRGGTAMNRTMPRFSASHQSAGLRSTAAHTAMYKSGLNSEGGASVGWEAVGSPEHIVLQLMQ